MTASRPPWRGFGILIKIILEIICFLQTHCEARQGKLVETNSGPIRGQIVKTNTSKYVEEYLGIPYAEAPIRNLRFKKPIPKQPWSMEYDATKFGKSCLQSLDTVFPRSFDAAWMWNAVDPPGQSEDCLYLNIWVPNEYSNLSKSSRLEPLTTMVWIFGGGFWSGTASLKVYDGKILATEENVIVVSMNYRVTIFGFLYMGDERAPGNQGLWDQHLALQWIRDNIKFFGGSADKVTIFGESAGAASVSLHCLSPMSNNLFQRAIMQSGSAVVPWAVEERDELKERAVVVATHLKCEGVFDEDLFAAQGDRDTFPIKNQEVTQWDNIKAGRKDELLEKSYECLMSPSTNTTLILDNEWVTKDFLDFPWTPVIDGDFIPKAPSEILKHFEYKPRKVLVGTMRDEAMYFILYQLLGKIFDPNKIQDETDHIIDEKQFVYSISSLLPSVFKNNEAVRNAIIYEYMPYVFPKPSATEWRNLKQANRVAPLPKRDQK